MANKNPKRENLKPFQPGISGNPNGREVGTKNRSTIARKWLDVEITAKNPLTGENERLSQEDLITLAQIKAALQSESTAYKVLMDSRYGAPKQEIEGGNANVINIKIE